MKKQLIINLLLPLICVCIYFNLISINPYFNTKDFIENIEVLSSPEYKGRLTGHIGSLNTGKFIEDKFNKFNIIPVGDKGTYTQSFPLNVVQLSGECSFKAFDSRGNLLKEYKYGKDFKELGFGKSIKGSIKGEVSSTISDSKPIYLFRQEMITEVDDIYKLDDVLTQHKVKAAIYTTESDFRFRTPYKLQQNYDSGVMKIMVTKDVSNQINSFLSMGVTFEIKTNTENKKVQGYNIVGMIKGLDESLPPIVLSSHLDHVGYDSDGIIYPGALDNASGTSFIIELAKTLKNSKPTRNIILACFDAEEVGLLGSKHFVSKPPIPLKGANAINLDMVACTKDIPLSVLSNQKNDLSKEILEIMNTLKIESNELNMDNSDHASFTPKGIDSITLIHDDTEKIHTPLDTVKNISEHRVIDVVRVVKSYLSKHNIIDEDSIQIHENIAMVEFYSRYIILSFVTLILLNILLFIRQRK